MTDKGRAPPTRIGRAQRTSGKKLSTPVYRIKVRKSHNCLHVHHTWRAAARCMWRPRLVHGDGPYALIIPCGLPTVHLFPTASQAVRARTWLGDCGSWCAGGHRVVRIAASSMPAHRRYLTIRAMPGKGS